MLDVGEDGEAESAYGSGEVRDGGEGREWVEGLPRGLRSGVREYLTRLDGLFEPKWAKTTRLVWTIWAFASAGYTVSPPPSLM